MIMLEKLENTYLSILRFVVIAVSGLLLIVFVFLAFGSFGVFKSEPGESRTPPQLNEQVIINGLTASNADQQVSVEAAKEETKVDQNKVYYERSAKALVDFVAKNSAFNESVDPPAIVEFVQNKAKAMGEKVYVDAYAKTFADAIEKALVDKKVVEKTKTTPAIDIVNAAANTFTLEFLKKMEGEDKAIKEQQAKYAVEKIEATSKLYMAAGAFAAFLLIVFLSIFIKIERNLRKLDVVKVNLSAS